jgi:hypothetical protein
MWLVDRVEIRERELDFSSAGGGRHATKGLFADGIEIVNALDFVDPSTQGGEAIQVTTCEQCGTPGCNSGGWVTLRRLDDGLTMVPAFGLLGRDDFARDQYGPPYFVDKRGAPVFKDAALAAIRDHLPWLADLSRVPRLSSTETALVLQWEAPYRVLQQFPAAPVLRHDLVAASSHGKGREGLTVFSSLMAEAVTAMRPVSLTPGEKVTFYLDRAGYPEWEPMAIVAGKYCLAIAPGLGVRFDDGSA